jgi:protein gp37
MRAVKIGHSSKCHANNWKTQSLLVKLNKRLEIEMAEQSKIEWTDHTFNPWEGCQKVAPECDNCYAEACDVRFTGGTHWGPKAPRRRTSAQNWQKPRRWNAQAEAFQATHGRRQRVFCASLADVFDNAVNPAWRSDLWALIRECDQMDWLLLTKRPQNMAKMLPPDWNDGWPNVWLGTSAGTQKTADQNIPHLLKTPAAIRFVSAEPMLGQLDLRRWLYAMLDHHAAGLSDDPMAAGLLCDAIKSGHASGPMRPALDWVICGGESGTNARPMHPKWAQALRDQCQQAGTAFLFKQWGEWGPDDFSENAAKSLWMSTDGTLIDGGILEVDKADCAKPVCLVVRHGKKAAGRTLDGREWNEVPT